MPTLAQISKTPYHWGKLKDNAKVSIRPESGRWDTTTPNAIIENGDTVRRMFKVYTSYDEDAAGTYDAHGNYCPPKINPELTKLYFQTYHNGKKVVAYVHPNEIDFITFKPVPKEFRSAATKGSRWRFVEDWTFAGFDGQMVEHTIPAGTEFTIKNNKTPLVYFGWSGYDSPHEGLTWEEKGIEIEDDPIFSQFVIERGFRRAEACMFLPMKEVAGLVEPVSAGQRKVYWLVEDNDGKKLLTKRYNNIGNVKAALRVRGGLIKYDYDSDRDGQPPEWISEVDNEWGTERLPLDNGIWAAQYDHATDTLITREDMLEYMTVAKLTA